MAMRMRPSSRPGRWAFALAAGFVVLTAVSPVVVALQGTRENETFLDNPLLSGLMLVAVLAGVAALVTGLIAVIRERDRAVSVVVSTALGALVLWVVIGVVLAGAA